MGLFYDEEESPLPNPKPKPAPEYPVPLDIRKSAYITDCRKFRYSLTRAWGTEPRLLCVMLNPSKADEKSDDHTVRKCIGFAIRNGCRALDIVNLYAYRTSNPEDLIEQRYPVGDRNDEFIRRMSEVASLIIVAWGVWGRPDRVAHVTQILRSHKRSECEIKCLGTTMNGSPRHPLYVSYETKLETFI